jgi:hypothetical protein
LWEAQTREVDPVKRKALVQDLERLMLIENYYLSINWWERIIIHHPARQGLAFQFKSSSRAGAGGSVV